MIGLIELVKEGVLVKQECQNMEVMLLSWNLLVQENAQDQGQGHAIGGTDHDQDQEIEVTGVGIGREEDPEVDLKVDTDPEAGTDLEIKVQIILNQIRDQNRLEIFTTNHNHSLIKV